jgi:hypothetical protein
VVGWFVTGVAVVVTADRLNAVAGVVLDGTPVLLLLAKLNDGVDVCVVAAPNDTAAVPFVMPFAGPVE